mmetsp:Transcript_65324/g.109455  ORF Transcript_65324/g.109455 Transcript_65324/m.109455 type:complete len:94 (-) Transcript_65324:632-913(-)
MSGTKFWTDGSFFSSSAQDLQESKVRALRLLVRHMLVLGSESSIAQGRLIPRREGGTPSSSIDTIEYAAWIPATPPEGCTDQQKAVLHGTSAL